MPTEIKPQPQSQEPEFKDSSTLLLVLSMLEVIFCGGLFALIPLILSFQYKDAVVARNLELMAKKKKHATIALIAVLIFAVLSISTSMFILWQSGFFDYIASGGEYAMSTSSSMF